MLRVRPFLIGVATIAGAIVLLGVIHHRAARIGDAREGARQDLAVGFLPVT